MSSLNKLKNKILGKEINDVEYLVDMARELGCVPDLIGRDYEVYDPSGKLMFRIKQKPMKIVQANALLKALHGIRKRESKELPDLKGRRK